MLVALTLRKLKPGSYEQFRKAWEPADWPEQWERAYHVRNVNDENEGRIRADSSGEPSRRCQ